MMIDLIPLEDHGSLLLSMPRQRLGMLVHTIGELPSDGVNASEFLDFVCQVLRERLGFDRVFAYQFVAEGNSKILAEAYNPEVTVPKYKGWIFPASGKYFHCKLIILFKKV
jgi:hypothetical protein